MKRYIPIPFLNLLDKPLMHDINLCGNSQIRGKFGKVNFNKKIVKAKSRVKKR